jgi:hypothetical protein
MTWKNLAHFASGTNFVGHSKHKARASGIPNQVAPQQHELGDRFSLSWKLPIHSLKQLDFLQGQGSFIPFRWRSVTCTPIHRASHFASSGAEKGLYICNLSSLHLIHISHHCDPENDHSASWVLNFTISQFILAQNIPYLLSLSHVSYWPYSLQLIYIIDHILTLIPSL